MKLVIVESPAKSKTIEKYLGGDYKVVSSVGHIRDLSTKGKFGLGVDVDNDFKHNGKKVGVGVYCYNDPNEMEENTEIINTSVGDYKIGFMADVSKNSK